MRNKANWQGRRDLPARAGQAGPSYTRCVPFTCLRGRAMNTAMSNAHEKAVEFLEHQKAFRLGELLTESSHPKTRRLSQTMQTDVQAGVRMLQSVDEDIPAALERIFAQDSFPQLVEAFREAIRTGRRIFFTGCGATGRLSILLEALWRRFWRERACARSSRPREAEGVPLGSRQMLGTRARCPHTRISASVSWPAGTLR